MNPFRLILITDDAGRSAGQIRAVVREAIAGGVTAVHLREKRASGRQIESLLRKLAPVCRAAGVPLLLNGSLIGRLDPPIDADGVHFGAGSIRAESGLGQESRSGVPLRLPSGFDFHRAAEAALGAGERSRPLLVGYSAHSIEEARTVLGRGADYVTLSPVFETPSKAGLLAPVGTGLIAVARTLLPRAVLVGLGGIDEANAGEVIRAGADGVAVIRAIMSSTDPRSAARRLRAQIDAALAARGE